MKRILRSKLALTLAAFLMIAAAIVIPLSGSIIHSHAQSTLVTFAKSATPTVAPGGTINYTLTLTNITPSGSGNLHDIHLNDTPPAQTSGTFTAPTFTITPPGSATVDCALSTSTSISCAVDDFAPGSVVTVSFSTTASSTAKGTITDTATAQSLDIGTLTAMANTTIIVPTPVPTPIPPQAKDCKADHTNVQTCAKQLSNDSANDLSTDLADRMASTSTGLACLGAIAALFPNAVAMLYTIAIDPDCVQTLASGAVQGYYLVLCLFNPICRSGLAHNPLAL